MTLGATTWCVCLRLGLVDCDGTATDFGAMQTGDGLFSLAIHWHFNEAKPLGLTGIAIDDDIDLVYLPKLAEHGCQFVPSSGTTDYLRKSSCHPLSIQGAFSIQSPTQR